MAKETEIEAGKNGAGGVGEQSPPTSLNSKEDLEKLSPELRAVIEKLIPTEEELSEERKRWDSEVERQKTSEFFNSEFCPDCPEAPGSPPKAANLKKLLKKALIWLKFRCKIGVKYTKLISHEEWMAVRAEPGYFIYNYEFGFLKNPKVTISSPVKETDYLFHEKTGHILIRRGLPIGIGSPFKVRVDIR